jgi:ribose/xylose/arabinose/galactoside ABC-type transport system permease subunit
MKQKIRAHLTEYILEIVLVMLVLGLSFTAPNFLTVGNLLTILQSESMKGIIAFGMTMAIISGEIDLSVGSMAAFAGCLTAWLVQQGVPIPLALLLTLAAGALIGCVTGLLRVQFKVPTFISTLALFTALRGGALMLTGGFALSPFPEWYNFIGGGKIGGVPFPALVLLLVFAASWFLMNYTAFGRTIYAVGGNAEATRLSGINVGRVRLVVLALTSTLAALAGIMLSSRMLAGDPTVAQGWELDVIAAVIIGGTSLFGGAGSMRGTLVGVIFIGVIVNGMTLLNVPVYGQYIVRGVLILAAVLLSQLQSKNVR